MRIYPILTDESLVHKQSLFYQSFTLLIQVIFIAYWECLLPLRIIHSSEKRSYVKKNVSLHQHMTDLQAPVKTKTEYSYTYI